MKCRQSRHMCLMLSTITNGSKTWAGYLAASSAAKQPPCKPHKMQLEQVNCG